MEGQQGLDLHFGLTPLYPLIHDVSSYIHTKIAQEINTYLIKMRNIYRMPGSHSLTESQFGASQQHLTPTQLLK